MSTRTAGGHSRWRVGPCQRPWHRSVPGGPRRAALGRHSPLRTHIRAALHIGFTQDQVIEVFMHMMLYGGIPFAREAMDVANDVFAHGESARRRGKAREL